MRYNKEGSRARKDEKTGRVIQEEKDEETDLYRVDTDGVFVGAFI